MSIKEKLNGILVITHQEYSPNVVIIEFPNTRRRFSLDENGRLLEWDNTITGLGREKGDWREVRDE